MEQEVFKKILESDIDQRMKEFFESGRKKIFYGAGNQAQACLEIMKQLRIPVGYLVTGDGKKGTEFHGTFFLQQEGKNLARFDVEEVPEEDRENCDILVAVNERHNDAIRKRLEESGFQHIYWSEDWNGFNGGLRALLFQRYLKEKIPGYREGDEIIQAGNFKIIGWNASSMSYNSMLVSEFYDLVAPSIFQDLSNLKEGPYEYGNVVLSEGDVVLDLGANIGLFSCVAASKGCQVYAFEPTPSTIELLRKNQVLYGDDFVIEPYAVCDQVGKMKFYCNTLKDDVSGTKNSLQMEHMGYEAILVDTISIDDFVEKKQLKRVDFIKADIEGAEREMLRGARETLAKFAPKLALCTYHLSDDKEVMERLILEANPDYVIEHKWEKLYASVPSRLK